MISKILGIGNKIDLTRTSAIENISEPSNLGKVYVSQILDIIDDEKLKIGMPIEQGKIKLFPINSRLDACFYTANGLYQGKLLVTDRYKEDAIFILVVEVISNLHKYQRRQYYRLGCIIDIKYKKITEKDIEEYEQNSGFAMEDNEFLEGTALDISGGGIRFVSGEKLEKGEELFILLEISYENQKRTYGLLGKIILSHEVKDKPIVYEHRIEFVNMQGAVRESLIKYIFEKERYQRQKRNETVD